MTDNCNIPTGMGKVGREIALGLQKRGHLIEYLGWFTPPWMENKMPFKIYQTRNQYYGSDVFDDVIMQSRPDYVITVGDEWMVNYIADRQRCKTRAAFQYIHYIPVDGAAYGEKLPPTWIESFKDADVKVAYTEYGKRVILNSVPELADEIKVIPHGVDANIFKPLPKAEIDNLRRNIGLDTIKANGEVSKKICYLMVARNQFRKNIPEIAKAWKRFKADGKHEKAVFFPHMNFQDGMGWNLDEIFDIMDIRSSLMFFDKIAHGQTNLKLMPEEDLNKLYNVADVFILLSGEGVGLPTLEAMACGKPVIVLDHSANTELAQGRGELVKVGNYITGKYGTERPYPDEESLVSAMDRLYKDVNLRQRYGQAGHDFIHSGCPGQYHGKALTWANACDQWDEIIKELDSPLSKPVKLKEIT